MQRGHKVLPPCANSLPIKKGSRILLIECVFWERHNMHKHIITLAALAALASPAWAVYKCTGADGRAAYQDTPCLAGGQQVDIRASSGMSPAPAPASPSRKLGLSDVEFNKYFASGSPAVGMSIAQLEQVFGYPATVNADNYSGIQKEQRIYDKGSDRWYIYTESGVVTSIQHRPGQASASYTASKNTGVRCPSALEIRNEETAASSITLPLEVRLKMLDRINTLKRACQ